MPKVTRIQPQKPILPPRKKVAAYARVSKDTEQLMHSLSAQVSYYSSLIQRTPEWEYAGVYVDAGITGTSVTARPEFQRLIADCEAGKINIVLTKSISRFARNTVDLLSTVRHLKELGVEVRFEKENISSLSGDGEVMLSILASFAEQESVNLSNNIKWTFLKKFKNGEVHSHQKMLGYRWEGDERLVVPEEAEIVRFVFSEYLAGKSYVAIARELDEKGVKSVHGAESFPSASVKLILKTEEYTGCMVMQKVHNISPKRQRLNRGELPKFKVDDHHKAIIDRETFDRVQTIMAERAAKNEGRKGLDSPFVGLIRCGKCGRSVCGHRTPTSLQNGDSRFVTWRCVGKNNGGKCDCKDAHNEELFAALQSIFGSEDADLRCVKRIQMHDEKLVFEMNNGRKETWRRT
jgi:DNA invertase Pin-like site-specific DNA recombinase